MADSAAAAETVSVAALEELAASLLHAVGVPAEAAALTAAALVAADVEDLASHGTMLLPMYVDRIRGGSVAAAARGRIVTDAGSVVVVDAENALGQVSADDAVRLARERARSHGLAAVAVRNAFHFGAAGYWARQLASAGCVGIAMANTRPLLPAPGGAERVVGNNPIAIAVPSADGEPIVADIAWSAGTMGRIRLAERSGEPIPPGWACDAQGVPTTDPGEAIRGMLLPAGGPKGFAMAMMIDLLCGGLSAGAIGNEVRPLYGDPALPYRCALFFLAMNIDAFRPADEFAAAAARFAHDIRASRRAPGSAGIRVPGDRARAARAKNAVTCTLAGATVRALRELAVRLDVTPPRGFPT
jgi:LDH2 family malate/lactate/ureidoglycolate dehydrogenase